MLDVQHRESKDLYTKEFFKREMGQSGKFADLALQMLRKYPRVALNNIKGMPGATKKTFDKRRSTGRNHKHGRGNKGMGHRMTLPPLGFEGGQHPFVLRIPTEPYYLNHEQRRQYPPMSLLQLQRMIDTGYFNVEKPIDLLQLCNTGHYKIIPEDHHFGVNLTDEGADIFQAKVNIEVQYANEATIAAIERNGGVILTRYYDPRCVEILTNIKEFLKKGLPIPKCKLPPQDAIEYYTNAKNRGYLADPEEIRKERVELAQKYGYDLPVFTDEDKLILLKRKDPRQIFYGLQPGWVINMKDEVVLKPMNPEFASYYME